MDKFKVTLVRQSKKPDPVTGKKKRTRRVLSDNKKEELEFNVKIHRGEN